MRTSSEQLAREASAALCQLMARLDSERVGGAREQLSGRVALAMQAIYRARALGSSAPQRAAGAATAERLLGECLALLQAQPALLDHDECVLRLAARAASAVYTLSQAAEAELRLVGVFAASSPPHLLGSQPAVLIWSRGSAVAHPQTRSPFVPPIVVADDADGDGSLEDAPQLSEDHEEDVPLSDLPAMPLDELRTLTAELLADNALEEEAAVDLEEPPAALLARAPEPPRPLVDEAGGELRAFHLGQLAEDFDMRRAGASSDATWSELERLEQAIFARADVLVWLDPNVAQPLAQSLLSARAAGPAFAAALPLLCIDQIDAHDAVLRVAQRGCTETADGLVEAFRLVENPEAAARLPALLHETADPVPRLIALRVAADRRCLDDADLERALSDPSPAIVGATAAYILQWGVTHALAGVEYMAERPAEDPAATEILVAAAILGSFRAREHLRARAHAGNVNDRLLHALAACGDESDVDAVADLALARGPLSNAAIIALGWLGSARAIPPLRELALDDEFSDEATEALNQLLGPRGAADPGAMLGQGRWSGGAPWTARAPLRLLVGEDTGSLCREIAFLELVARTGRHVPFDPTWPVTRQRAAAASWTLQIEPLADQLPTGTWTYRGRSIPTTTGRYR